MKIAVVSDYLDPLNWGGASRVAAMQARELTRGGHEVLLLGASSSLARVGSCRHVAFPHRPGLRGAWNLRRHVRAHVGAFAPDLVVAHQPLVARFVIEQFPQVRLRYVFHSSWSAEVEARGGRPGMRRRVERHVLRMAEKIFCTSPFTMGELERTEASSLHKSKVNPLAVESPPFVPDPGRDEWVRRTHDIPKGMKAVAVFRRLTARTGVDLAIQTVKECPDVFLLVGGTGEQAGAMRDLAAKEGITDRCRFLGYVPEDQMVALLQGASAVMVPSRDLEGFGLSTLEAMACGCPVVATDVGNNRALVEQCSGGALSEGEGPDALASALRRVLEASWDRVALGQRVRHSFSWYRHVQELLC